MEEGFSRAVEWRRVSARGRLSFGSAAQSMGVQLNGNCGLRLLASDHCRGRYLVASQLR